MTDPHDPHTVAREDLLFAVEIALLKAEHLWPKRNRPGDHDRLKPMAQRIVDHTAAVHLLQDQRVGYGRLGDTVEPLGIKTGEPKRDLGDTVGPVRHCGSARMFRADEYGSSAHPCNRDDAVLAGKSRPSGNTAKTFTRDGLDPLSE